MQIQCKTGEKVENRIKTEGPMKRLFFKSLWYKIKTLYFKLRFRKLKPLATMSRPERRRYMKRVAKALLFSMPDRYELTRAQARGIAKAKAEDIVSRQTGIAQRLWGTILTN